ncbi:hypothetical protein LXL04_018971 [Taraxacum kok-saghyz]
MDMKKWRSKTVKPDRIYDHIDMVSSDTQPAASPSQSVWKVLWKKLKREKKRLMVRSSSVHAHQVPYDEYNYLQNFDQGLEWNSESEPEILSKSFSVRYTNRRSAMVPTIQVSGTAAIDMKGPGNLGRIKWRHPWDAGRIASVSHIDLNSSASSTTDANNW